MTAVAVTEVVPVETGAGGVMPALVTARLLRCRSTNRFDTAEIA